MAVFAPREHDLWIAETRQLEDHLAECGAEDLSLVHLEYALLSRALRDLLGEVDRPGVHTWGFGRRAGLDGDLARFRQLCTDA